MGVRTPVIIDTDANNELDDQHAMAYALLQPDVFDVVGVTVNNTPLGNGIQGQYDEAKRILHLCDRLEDVPLLKGAEGNLTDILPDANISFDGQDAVNFIIEAARASRSHRLVLIPIGKLTNIALALNIAPDIAERVRIVWLGSNYPESGEYNLAADPASVNAVIQSSARFEMVTVRYTKPTGSSAVAVDIEEISARMPGLGPRVAPIAGRHGGDFSTFGDYSISLFENVGSSRRPLFDVVAVAVVKDPAWGQCRTIQAPILDGIDWNGENEGLRPIQLWENFDRDGIIEDFFQVMSIATR